MAVVRVDAVSATVHVPVEPHRSACVQGRRCHILQQPLMRVPPTQHNDLSEAGIDPASPRDFLCSSHEITLPLSLTFCFSTQRRGRGRSYSAIRSAHEEMFVKSVRAGGATEARLPVSFFCSPCDATFQSPLTFSPHQCAGWWGAREGRGA